MLTSLVSVKATHTYVQDIYIHTHPLLLQNRLWKMSLCLSFNMQVWGAIVSQPRHLMSPRRGTVVVPLQIIGCKYGILLRFSLPHQWVHAYIYEFMPNLTFLLISGCQSWDLLKKNPIWAVYLRCFNNKILSGAENKCIAQAVSPAFCASRLNEIQVRLFPCSLSLPSSHSEN